MKINFNCVFFLHLSWMSHRCISIKRHWDNLSILKKKHFNYLHSLFHLFVMRNFKQQATKRCNYTGWLCKTSILFVTWFLPYRDSVNSHWKKNSKLLRLFFMYLKNYINSIKKSAVTFLTLAKNKLELLHVKEYKENTSKQI